MQCPSCDGERGQSLEEMTEVNPKIAFRYATGSDTIGGIYVKVGREFVETTLYDRDMNVVDSCKIKKKER